VLGDRLALSAVEDRLIVNFARVFAMTTVETLVPAIVCS
jgi:hypothetical protein